MKKNICLTCMLLLSACGISSQEPIDREALVTRHNPHNESADPLSSLTVGNGEFAFTTDITGLQTFPEHYKNGLPLGTQSQWGWHSFPNPQHYSTDDALRSFDFGHGHAESYPCLSGTSARAREAASWLRANPHRLHLGIVGLDLDIDPNRLTDAHQTLDMWQGKITSDFRLDGTTYRVQTVCHPDRDLVAATVANKAHTAISLRFPYPTGGHTDDACRWDTPDRHVTELIQNGTQDALLKRTLDSTTYYVRLAWKGKATLAEKSPHCWALTPQEDSLSFVCEFLPVEPAEDRQVPDYAETEKASANSWKRFWTEGAAVDFSHCTDPRAAELERRVVLSQYLLATQCAGSLPPQETGLTYNSWHGKFHLEMTWWHQAWMALWGHEDKLAHTLEWYAKAAPMARATAHRQGFDGVRWMKMTGPDGQESPSNIGPFLIWQQPHYIYLAELVYRANPDNDMIRQYGPLIEETADFMYSFATYDKQSGHYLLKGCIPAQETLSASTTVNPPFELAYWHYAMRTAQTWRERAGQPRDTLWDKLIDGLPPLAHNADGLYLASADATNTYKDRRFTSDHPAILGATGIVPISPLVNEEYMRNTLHWTMEHWNWEHTWGWDYPMTAMNATRLGEPDIAVDALLMERRTNTYLKNGHNYQNTTLRCYLPGNGGLLTAIALMCAGWDGCGDRNPGFPRNGKWDVRWEGLKPMP